MLNKLHGKIGPQVGCHTCSVSVSKVCKNVYPARFSLIWHPRITHPHTPNEPTSSLGRWSLFYHYAETNESEYWRTKASPQKIANTLAKINSEVPGPTKKLLLITNVLGAWWRQTLPASAKAVLQEFHAELSGGIDMCFYHHSHNLGSAE